MAVSLAEAETIRRVLHVRGKLPLVRTDGSTTTAEVARAAAEEQPPLFEGLDAGATDEAEENLFGDDDGLPPPAYRPAEKAAEPAPQPQMVEAEEADIAEAFVAPKAGGPSPEVLARLQAAVQKSPKSRPAAVPQPAAPATPATGDAAERPRFGINSLIGRMTGHGEAASHKAPPVRRQPPVTAPEEELELDPEQERIEIPAFLRRQAN